MITLQVRRLGPFMLATDGDIWELWHGHKVRDELEVLISCGRLDAEGGLAYEDGQPELCRGQALDVVEASLQVALERVQAAKAALTKPIE